MRKIRSINPANNNLIAEVMVSTEKEIREKVNHAHSVKQHWKSLGVEARVELLRPLVSAFKARGKEIAEITMR